MDRDNQRGQDGPDSGTMEEAAGRRLSPEGADHTSSRQAGDAAGPGANVAAHGRVPPQATGETTSRQAGDAAKPVTPKTASPRRNPAAPRPASAPAAKAKLELVENNPPKSAVRKLAEKARSRQIEAVAELAPGSLAQAAAAEFRSLSGRQRFDLAVLLGSGWHGAADMIGETVFELNADQLPGFCPSPVPGHHGTIQVVETPGGNNVLVIGARHHYYDGRDATAVAHPVRFAAALGVHCLVQTNGCGSLNRALEPGTVALIRDHINLTGASPLSGASFVDLTDAYSANLRYLIRSALPELGEATYAQFAGPQYETPAEVRMAGLLGADLVGMSTALETIAARQAGLEVVGMSLVTNMAAGITGEPLKHFEVLSQGINSGPRNAVLLAAAVGLILIEVCL